MKYSLNKYKIKTKYGYWDWELGQSPILNKI